MTTNLSDSATHRLENDQIGWLTTVHGDQPQSSPVWFVYADGTVWMRTRPVAGKVRNVAGNPRVSFHLNSVDGGNVVTIDGTAQPVDTWPDAVREVFADKYRQGIKTVGGTLEAMEADYSVTLRLTPTRARTW